MKQTQAFDKNGNKNRIYHFTSKQIAIDKILPHYRLRLNPLKRTNDPRESKSFIFNSISDKDSIAADPIKDSLEFSEILRSDCKVLCFTMDTENHKWGYEIGSMWAHYGSNHKGVCLELDKEEFIKENCLDPEMFREVKYDIFNIFDQPENKVIDYREMKKYGKKEYLLSKFRYEYMDYLYFTKSDEWKYENEIRLLHFSKNNYKSDEFLSFEKSIRNIIVGVDFNAKQVVKLRSTYPDLEVTKLKFGGLRIVQSTD